MVDSQCDAIFLAALADVDRFKSSTSTDTTSEIQVPQ